MLSVHNLGTKWMNSLPLRHALPAGYPETYFGRMPLPQKAVMAVVAACRADDIYHQVLPAKFYFTSSIPQSFWYMTPYECRACFQQLHAPKTICLSP